MMISPLRSRVRGLRFFISVTVIATSFVLTPQTHVVTEAADSDLDPTFGPGGIVLTDFNGEFNGANGVAIQPDGKIVVVGSNFAPNGDFAVARYNPDGSLDAAFGTGGLVLTDIGGGSIDQGRAVALQADGKIVAVGETTTEVSPSDQDWAVVRYNTDGTLDATFDGDGIVKTDFGSIIFENATSVAIQADGKIVAGGGAFEWGGPTQRNFGVARYNTDGSLDTTFDGDGRVITSFTDNFDVIADIAIQTDGRIVALGFANADFGFARYNTDGSLDASFGGTGALVLDFAGNSDEGTELALQPDGKIVAVGRTVGADFALARLNTDGTVDPTFGTAGRVLTDFPTVFGGPNAVALQADGKIVVTGPLHTPAVGTDVGVARYDASGALDATFGVAGLRMTDVAGSSDDPQDIAIQPDGKIVVVGQASFGTVIGFGDFSVIRYEGPPPHDVTFYLHGFDVPGTAGAFTMNQTAPATQVLVTASSSRQWLSEPFVNGTFLSGSTFEVTLPCRLGVAAPRTVSLASTDASGGAEQPLGQAVTAAEFCHTQTISVPVTVPVTFTQRRLKLTIASSLPIAQPLRLGSQTFVRATNFVGAP
jgi:uncharacterized delta-60 repeat protein